MPEEKTLRVRLAEIIGIEAGTPQDIALYLLADKLEALEKQIKGLNKRTSGLQRFG